MSTTPIDPGHLDNELFMAFLECEVRSVKTETYRISGGTMLFMPDLKRVGVYRVGFPKPRYFNIGSRTLDDVANNPTEARP